MSRNETAIGGFGMEKVDQTHCPICGREFDIMEPAVHMDARGPSFAYCACNICKKAWEIGQFRRGDTTVGIREVDY